MGLEEEKVLYSRSCRRTSDAQGQQRSPRVSHSGTSASCLSSDGSVCSSCRCTCLLLHRMAHQRGFGLHCYRHPKRLGFVDPRLQKRSSSSCACAPEDCSPCAEQLAAEDQRRQSEHCDEDSTTSRGPRACTSTRFAPLCGLRNDQCRCRSVHGWSRARPQRPE